MLLPRWQSPSRQFRRSLISSIDHHTAKDVHTANHLSSHIRSCPVSCRRYFPSRFFGMLMKCVIPVDDQQISSPETLPRIRCQVFKSLCDHRRSLMPEDVSWRTRILLKIASGKHDKLSGMIRVPRGFTSSSVVLTDDGSGGSQLVANEGTLLFSLEIASESRAGWVTLRTPRLVVKEGARRVLVPGSNLPSFLPAFLSFRRYALCGAPVAPAYIDRHQMASGNLTRPRAAPLRPQNPRQRHPARITLAREGFPPLCAIFMAEGNIFSYTELHYLSCDV